MPADRFAQQPLTDFTIALFTHAGMEAEKAEAVARLLVTADAMGHATHGLGLVPRYLQEIAAGAMAITGEPDVISDRGACLTWDGKLLPGLWLADKALDIAMERVATYGTVSVAIGRGHHLGCLAVYPQKVAARGYVLFMATSAPGARAVAPFGSRTATLSPAPVAAGFPTQADPVLVDISGSITTMNMASALVRDGQKFPREWVMTPDGTPTDDPQVLLTGGGSLLPAGGTDHGQKGYGWGLITESLSQGLSGQGRADGPTGMQNAVFLQVIDPDAFAGADAFRRQTAAITGACLAAEPLPGHGPVRLPGGRAQSLQRDAAEAGVKLAENIVAGLQAAAAKAGLQMPAPM